MCQINRGISCSTWLVENICNAKSDWIICIVFFIVFVIARFLNLSLVPCAIFLCACNAICCKKMHSGAFLQYMQREKISNRFDIFLRCVNDFLFFLRCSIISAWFHSGSEFEACCMQILFCFIQIKTTWKRISDGGRKQQVTGWRKNSTSFFQVFIEKILYYGALKIHIIITKLREIQPTKSWQNCLKGNIH